MLKIRRSLGTAWLRVLRYRLWLRRHQEPRAEDLAWLQWLEHRVIGWSLSAQDRRAEQRGGQPFWRKVRVRFGE